MKRYRVLNYDFDTRANFLTISIKPDWEENVKKQWENNKRHVREGLLFTYGIEDSEQKIQNFIDIGAIPFSVIAFHNVFFRQSREAFVIGSYYPALTSACALGERILNQLILHLRDYFKLSPEYKKVYRKDSFDDWDLAINVLENWKVLLPSTAQSFRELKAIRNASLHFNPETDTNTRQTAKEAIKKLSAIIQEQFAGFGKQPWFIPCRKGTTFVRKDWENNPFVKEIILPNCYLVGYKHKLDQKNGKWIVHDDYSYNLNEILSDEKFIELFENVKNV
ncbi:MAG: hypothetical protein WC476_12515 [Phycisphaerae bacterium]|jgi:hypothetical protein